jgi:hypothetical protein
MGRPALFQGEKLAELILKYESAGIAALGKEYGVSETCIFHTLKRAGIQLRPKHVVLNNHMKGKDHSGDKNSRWKGGLNKCQDCNKLLGNRKALRCVKCHGFSKRGHTIPVELLKIDQSKLARRRIEYKEWRNAVFIRDAYKCQLCGVNHNDLHPHHLDGFCEFPDKRYLVENGVTLCSAHHKLFHKTYGYGKNTEAQFREFQELFNKDYT